MSTATKNPKAQAESKKPVAEKPVAEKLAKAASKVKSEKSAIKLEGTSSIAPAAVTTKPSTKKKTASVSETNPVSPSFTPYQSATGEEYMSDTQVLHFKKLLTDWKDELISEAESTKSYIQDESSAMPDINDRATQEEEFALALRTRDRERKLIRKIDKSLVDIESGDYGFCHTCGVEIGIRRLEARPTATQCIDCKTLAEMKEKQTWGHI